MQSYDTDVIQQNYKFLVRNIPTKEVVDQLYHIGVLSREDRSKILKEDVAKCSFQNTFKRFSQKEEPRDQLPRADSTRLGALARDTVKKNKRLLYILQRRGSEALSIFLNSLDPKLQKQLKTLENDISNITL